MKGRLLLVTRNFPPLVGGMERLNWHLAAELASTHEVRVIAPSGSAAHAPKGIELIEVPLRPLWKFLACATWRAVRETRRWNPDLVLAGSGLTALPAWLAARTGASRAAAYLHGLDITVPNPVYRKVWLPAIRRMDRVIVNSHPTAKLAISAGVPAARLGIVHPGVDLPESRRCPNDIAAFRARYALDDRPVLLSVGRLSARKGLREFVSHALPRIAAAHPAVVLLVVGNPPSDALYAEAQSPESILDTARLAGLSDNIRILGRIPDDELSLAYLAADAHVFPVRELAGDPEGFGMVAIEAAAHGLSTVAFAAGGVVDAVSERESGTLVAAGDYAAFAEAVVAVLGQRCGLSETCQAFATRFAWPEFGIAMRRELGS